MPPVFISYRRGDSAGYAGRLHESLEERLGAGAVFRDVDTIEPGQDFANAIQERLRDSSVLLAVIGREWLDAREPDGTRRLDSPSDYVRLEIAAALARADVRVIPVLVEGAAMPQPGQLPEVLRPLAQRQAVALHDEDWNAGMDRLAAAVRKAGFRARPGGGLSPGRALLRVVSWRVALPALAIIALLVLGWLLPKRLNTIPVDEPANRPSGSDANASGAIAPALDVPIPRLCEVVDGDLVYSVISASVRPLAGQQEVRVRIRIANDGAYDANFWDASFRLRLPDGVDVTPHGGLNEIAAGHSVRDAVVAFTIPARVSSAILLISTRSRPGEIPLALQSANGPARSEDADAGHVLSRAIVRTLVSEPRPLLESGGLEVTLTRVLTRGFANATRLRVSVRFANHTGYAASAGALTLRAAVADQVLAPVSAPMDVIEHAADASGDFVFDLPADATRVTLRAWLQNASATTTLELIQGKQ